MTTLLTKIKTEERIPAKLSDYIKIKHGFAFKGEYFSTQPASDILVTPGNFAIGGGFKSSKFKYYKGPVVEDYLLKKNDLVVTMTDLSVDADTLGYSALIPDNNVNRFLHNQRIGLVQKKNDGIDFGYLYYLMRTREYQKYVVSTASGSTVKHTSPDRITDYEYDFPSLPTQKKIAKVLSSYDTKLDNNDTIIKNLESIAQTIFNEWFVNFHFHGYEKSKFIESEMGEIPEEWLVGSVKDLVKVESGFAFKSSMFDSSGSYKLVTIRNVQDGSFIAESENLIKTLPDKMPAHCVLSSGDILLSLTGNVGRVCIVNGKDYVLNQRVSALVPVNERDRAYTYFLFRRKSFQNLLISIAKGTAQLNLSPIETKNLEILVPSKSVLEKYSEVVTPMYKKIVAINAESENLKKTRDQLISKLI